ncbi:MAG: NAD(P)/FAD-dependent oxidoreductase [Nitrospiraceae bacterium]
MAIVGTGISGLVAAPLLHHDHNLTLFEANSSIGGHTNTIEVDLDGMVYPIDTGFIVFNDWTYPNFITLLDRLNVASQPSTMSFSVRCEHTGLEYNGTTINSLFAQRTNLFRPSFCRMVRDIVRFNREAPALLHEPGDGPTIGQYLQTQRYSDEFIRYYILPMGAAIWSASTETVRACPAHFFVQFFHNHGMLSVDNRPTWRVVKGGSYQYVKALTRPLRDRIRLNSPVRSIVRTAEAVEIASDEWVAIGQVQRRREQFDHVILAVHSDQALSLLKHPTRQEREILGAIPYQENEAVLHTDASLLPTRRLAWASWNYHILKTGKDRVAVTYHMNQLQGIQAPKEFCVTLNRSDDIDPSTIIERITYHHPSFTSAAVAAQQRHHEINGVNRTSYCGAYWSYGFHEDGVKSALAVCRLFDKDLSS